MDVLVTNANTKHALAAVRSLGKKGLNVATASHTKLSMAFFSRCSKSRHIYPSPENAVLFTKVMLNIVRKNKFNVILPIGSDISILLSKHLNEYLKYTKIPLANYDMLTKAYDKAETLKIAIENGIPCPQTFFPESVNEVENIAKKIDFPAVIKIRKGAGAKGVVYVNTPAELVFNYKRIHNTPSPSIFENYQYPLIQEYISGEGRGFFALFNNSEPIAFFAHKRLREYPITGGPSVLAESVRCDPKIKEYGIKLLKALNWHGVAMVEFKIDSRNGQPKLMEINPKFWGSLDLAIASGVDFPYLAYKMAIGDDVKPVFTYKEGIRFRWLLPYDVLHLLSSPNKISAFKEFLKFRNENLFYDISLDDPLPNIIQLGKTFYLVLSLIKDKILKRG